ncbi:hypothetical protein WEH80_38215 [Actinomycetes bacterium KLBMP 9759]
MSTPGQFPPPQHPQPRYSPAQNPPAQNSQPQFQQPQYPPQYQPYPPQQQPQYPPQQPFGPAGFGTPQSQWSGSAPAPRKRSRAALALWIALPLVLVLGVVATVVVVNWEVITDRRTVRNVTASTSYEVPYSSWKLDEEPLDLLDATWTGIAQYGFYSCTGSGPPNLVSGTIASTAYPRSGAFETPEKALAEIHPTLVTAMGDSLVDVEPGPVTPMVLDGGVRGARIDVRYGGVFGACGPEPIPSTLTVMAFPATGPTGTPVMTMIYTVFDDVQVEGAPPLVPPEQRQEIVESIRVTA